MKKIINNNKKNTNNICSLAASLTPTIFNKTKNKVIIAPLIKIGKPLSIKITSEIPKTAKALFKEIAIQPNNPETVPIRGPKDLLIK